jgi:hypothetical protein
MRNASLSRPTGRPDRAYCAASYLFKAILQCLPHRFGLGFAGQGRQIGSQFFGFAVSNVQSHVSLRVDIFLHRYDPIRAVAVAFWQAFCGFVRK